MTALGIAVSAIVLCSNANWEHSERCKQPPIIVEPNEAGEFFSTLTNGVPYSQTNVTNELGVRLQRFQLENAFWFVSDKGVIEANSDVEALSKYLSL